MRLLTDHVTNEINAKLRVVVVDEPGQGGAHHAYFIDGFIGGNPGYERLMNAAMELDDGSRRGIWTGIVFQNGPIKEFGVNGITHEVLLAILIDRMRSFQSGPFACEANAQALSAMEQALRWLHGRTSEREVRGVEGTNQP